MDSSDRLPNGKGDQDPLTGQAIAPARNDKKEPSQTRDSTERAFGVREVTRTPGLPLRRRSLYPTELRRHGWEAVPGNCGGILFPAGILADEWAAVNGKMRAS